MRYVRKGSAAALGITAAIVVFSAAAWACVSGPAIKLSQPTAQAGQELQVTGSGWRAKTDPVTIRFNALDGPVLVTAPVKAGEFTTALTVPPGTKAGSYVLVATQNAPDGTLSQAPSRALLTVVGETGAKPVLGETLAPVAEERPAGLVTDNQSISGGALALIALGVAGFGLFLAGMAALIASRRGDAPAAAPARQ